MSRETQLLTQIYLLVKQNLTTTSHCKLLADWHLRGTNTNESGFCIDRYEPRYIVKTGTTSLAVIERKDNPGFVLLLPRAGVAAIDIGTTDCRFP